MVVCAQEVLGAAVLELVRTRRDYSCRAVSFNRNVVPSRQGKQGMCYLVGFMLSETNIESVPCGWASPHEMRCSNTACRSSRNLAKSRSYSVLEA